MINFRQNDINTQLRYHNHGPSGIYDQLNWKISTGSDTTDIASQTVSIHEFMHNELNNTSTYGFLLQGYAYLSREETPLRTHFSNVLSALIESCRTAHEVYATWMSINLLSTDVNDKLDQELLADNEEYLNYYNKAKDIVRSVPDLYLRRHIITAVINICFQSKIITETATIDLATFNPDKLNKEEFPNQRLDFIANSFDHSDWMKMLQSFAQTQQDKPWYDLLCNALAGRGDEKVLSKSENESNSLALLTFIYDQLDLKLSKQGLLSLPYLSHFSYFITMMPLLDNLAPFSHSDNPLTVNTQPNDITRSMLQNFENETLLFSNRPLACIVLQPEGISAKTKVQILSGVGEYPHVFVTGRTYNFMQEQYVFLEQEDAEWCEQGIGSFTAIRYAGNMEGQRVVVYVPFSEPAELKDFLKDKASSISIISSISETACYDKDWLKQWGDFFESSAATTSILLDISPLYYIEKVLYNTSEVLYDKMDIIMDKQVKSAMLFQIKDHDETIALIACPCSEIYARGLHHYVETRFPLFKNGIDLSGEHMQNIPAVMSHVFREEYQHYYRSKA